jgi:phage tail-like protein
MGDRTLANYFNLDLGVYGVGAVTQVEGISVETEIVEYRDGEDDVMHTRPGNHMPGKIIVTRDWKNTDDWHRWRKTVQTGQVDYISFSVIFLKDGGPSGEPTEVGRLNFFNGWPSKHKHPEHNSKTSGHATESLEISFETIKWVLK